MFNGMVATYPHVKAGKIKLIAISSTKRNAQMPDTPTVAESLPGFFIRQFSAPAGPGGHAPSGDRQTARRSATHRRHARSARTPDHAGRRAISHEPSRVWQLAQGGNSGYGQDREG